MHISYYTIAEVFGASEIILLLVKRSKKGVIKNQSDKRSLLVLWLCITASIAIGTYATIAGLWPLPYTRLVMDTGLAIALLGFIIRWTAILQLGKMFTVDVAITSGHRLKTTGLYKIVRHPSYLGLMLIICSIAVLESNMLSYLLIFPVFLALNYRISVEEQALVAEFGDEYQQYKKTTARLIPGIY